MHPHVLRPPDVAARLAGSLTISRRTVARLPSQRGHRTRRALGCVRAATGQSHHSSVPQGAARPAAGGTALAHDRPTRATPRVVELAKLQPAQRPHAHDSAVQEVGTQRALQRDKRRRQPGGSNWESGNHPAAARWKSQRGGQGRQGHRQRRTRQRRAVDHAPARPRQCHGRVLQGHPGGRCCQYLCPRCVPGHVSQRSTASPAQLDG